MNDESNRRIRTEDVGTHDLDAMGSYKLFFVPEMVPRCTSHIAMTPPRICTEWRAQKSHRTTQPQLARRHQHWHNLTSAKPESKWLVATVCTIPTATATGNWSDWRNSAVASHHATATAASPFQPAMRKQKTKIQKSAPPSYHRTPKKCMIMRSIIPTDHLTRQTTSKPFILG